MLHVYHSHKIENLLQILLKLLQYNIPEPFSATHIIVPSLGIAHYINLEIAKQFSIAANIKFQLPREFLWSIARSCIDDIPNHEAFSVHVLSLRILHILKAAQNDNEHNLRQYQLLSQYISNADEHKLCVFSQQIASIIDSYLVYRPEWINSWEQNKLMLLGDHEKWQASLWREISSKTSFHKAKYIYSLSQGAQFADIKLDAVIPNSIFVFGVSGAIPLNQIDFLHYLSQKSDIFVFAFNPSREFWGDMGKKQHPSQIAQDYHELLLTQEPWYSHYENNLLATCGAQGRNFLNHLFKLQQNSTGIYLEDDELKNDTLLHTLQNNIMTLQQHKFISSTCDTSIAVHIAHSKMREVQILHNEILKYLEADQKLALHQIVVLAPNIADYGAYIQSVFNSENKLNYSISDHQDIEYEHCLSALLSIIKLAFTKFSINDIFNILESECICNKFNIDPKSLSILQDIIYKAGARFGFDENWREAHDDVKEYFHTIQHALDRLILGFISLQDNISWSTVNITPVFDNISAINNINSNLYAQIQGFSNFVNSLAAFSLHLNTHKTLQEYANCFLNAATDFLEMPENQTIIMYINENCSKLATYADYAEFNNQVGLKVAVTLFEQISKKTSTKPGLLTGSINFVSATPMRSLPCKMICFIGLEEGQFPRVETRLDYNLLQASNTIDNRDTNLDDRYLFLESILNARKYLYISYVGISTQNAIKRPASVLVNELLDNLSRITSEDYVAEHIIHNHAMHPFSTKNFALSAHNFSQDWFAAVQGYKEDKQYIQTQKTHNTNLDILDLINCFVNPARFYLQAKSVKRQTYLANKTPYEDFSLTNKHKQQIINLGVKCKLQENMQDDDLIEQIRTQMLLPQGLSKQYWGLIKQDINNIVNLLKEYMQSSVLDSGEVLIIKDLGVNKSTLSVALDKKAKYYTYDFGAASLIDTWLYHLASAAADIHDSAYQKTAFVQERATSVGYVSYKDLDPTTAKDILSTWIDLLHLNVCKPLFLPNRTAFAYSKRLWDSKRTKDSEELIIKKALIDAYGFYNGGFHIHGEMHDRYHKIVFNKLEIGMEDFINASNLDVMQFQRNCELLYKPALENKII